MATFAADSVSSVVTTEFAWRLGTNMSHTRSTALACRLSLMYESVRAPSAMVCAAV